MNSHLKPSLIIVCPLEIDVQYSIAHVHTHNGLAKSVIKNLQLIARPLLLNTKLPLSAWGHAIIHAVNLIRLHITANQDLFSLQLVLGYQPNISHLRVFGCAVCVSLTPTHQTKLGPQRRFGPNMHLTNFIEVCDTIKYNGVTEEALGLRLFPFSLGDRAKHWLTSQPSDSITSWNDLM